MTQGKTGAGGSRLKALGRGLLLFLAGEAAAYIAALWQTRRACPGVEHLLEGLIRLLTGGWAYHLGAAAVALGLWGLGRLIRHSGRRGRRDQGPGEAASP